MLTRRKFLQALPFALAGAGLLDSLAVEPYWISEPRLDFSHIGSGKKLIHFSDLHYRGNDFYTRHIINRINRQSPDLVVFTGDLVEGGSQKHLSAALEYIQQIEAPCYGVPGNHDPQDARSTALFKAAFEKTGGAFLVNERCELNEFVMYGVSGMNGINHNETKPVIMMCHYPAIGDSHIQKPYALTLCGHSHGGQVRIPLWGAIVLPPGVGRYVRGLYQSNVGPLYVNPGVGTFLVPIRFCCRPEITQILI